MRIIELDGRSYVDVEDKRAKVGDIIVLSGYNLLWKVTHTTTGESKLYLKSVIGARVAVVDNDGLVAIYRDPTFVAPPNYRELYKWDDYYD